MSTIHFDHSNLQPKRPCNQSTCNDGTSTPSTDTYSSRDSTFYWLQTRWHRLAFARSSNTPVKCWYHNTLSVRTRSPHVLEHHSLRVQALRQGMEGELGL